MADGFFRIKWCVNSRLPEFGRGIISPAEMTEKRQANCFGRLAVIGSQLIAEGAKSTDLGWLFSLNHGIEFAPGRHWFGHAFLTISEPTPRLVDSMDRAFCRGLSSTSWSPHTEPILPVVDYIVAKEICSGAPAFGEDALGRQNRSIGYARAWALRAFFSSHGFNDGLVFYQSAHPKLSEQPPIRAEEYAAFYSTLADVKN